MSDEIIGALIGAGTAILIGAMALLVNNLLQNRRAARKQVGDREDFVFQRLFDAHREAEGWLLKIEEALSHATVDDPASLNHLAQTAKDAQAWCNDAKNLHPETRSSISTLAELCEDAAARNDRFQPIAQMLAQQQFLATRISVNLFMVPKLVGVEGIASAVRRANDEMRESRKKWAEAVENAESEE